MLKKELILIGHSVKQQLNFSSFIHLLGIYCLLLPITSLSNNIPGSFIYQGRAFDSSSIPITGTVDIKIQILDTSGQCILLSEKHDSLDLSTTDGVFSLSVGSNTGSSVRTAAGDDPNISTFDVFSNGINHTGLSGTGCGGSYNGASGDDRVLRVTITKDSTDTVLADQRVGAVPFAWNAQQVQGKDVLFTDGTSSPQLISFQNHANDTARDAAVTAAGGVATGQMVVNNGSLQIYTGASWENIPTGSGAGETNTASNQGAGGVGVYSTKSGVDFQFKNINAGSSKITVTNDAGNTEIDIDVTESNLDLANLGGTLDLASGGTGSGTASGARTNLGLVIGTNIQAYDADLAELAALNCSNGEMIEHTGGAFACVTTPSSGEVNTVSHVGTGVGKLFKQKATADFEFKSLAAGNMISVSNGTDDVSIAVSPDTDGTFASASDTEVPSQLAVKTYVDGQSTGYDSSYVNVTGDSMTGALNITSSSDGTIFSTSVTGQTNNNGLWVESDEASNTLSLTASGSNTPALLFKTGSNEWMRILSTGNVGIGTNNPSYKLHVEESKTDTLGTHYMVEKAFTATVSAASSATFIADNSVVSNTGSTNDISQMVASRTVATNASSTTVTNNSGVLAFAENVSTGTVVSSIGINSWSRNTSSGSITNSKGIVGISQNSNSGTVTAAIGVQGIVRNEITASKITSAYGVYASLYNSATSGGGGYITNTYGVYIDDVTSGEQTNTAFGLYQVDADAHNYFAGNLGIGTTLPDEKLHITGNIKVDGQLYVDQTLTASSTTAVDFNSSNVQILEDVGGTAITLNNMMDGGTYKLIITDTVSRTYTFTNCTNSYFQPTNAPTAAGTRTIYTILKVTESDTQTHCYISWTTGFN